MARKKREVKPLPTLWEVSDELWTINQHILDELDPPAETGRLRADPPLHRPIGPTPIFAQARPVRL